MPPPAAAPSPPAAVTAASSGGRLAALGLAGSAAGSSRAATRRRPGAARLGARPGRRAPVSEAELNRQVLADLQRQLELMLEVRLREALAPILARATDALVRDARKELTAAMRDIVARSVAQELARRRGRLKRVDAVTPDPLSMKAPMRTGPRLRYRLALRARVPIRFQFQTGGICMQVKLNLIAAAAAVDLRRRRVGAGHGRQDRPRRPRPAAPSPTSARTTRTAPAWRSRS